MPDLSHENPFAFAPTQVPSVEAVTTRMPTSMDDVESVRKTYLTHEASVRSCWLIYCLGAVLVMLYGITGIAMSYTLVFGTYGPTSQFNSPNEAMAAGIASLALGMALIAFAIFQFWVGTTLARLKPIARTTGSIVAGVWLVVIPFGTLIGGCILYLLLSYKGQMVLSPYYREIIRLTPKIKYKTSIIVWVFLAILLALIGLGVIGILDS